MRLVAGHVINFYHRNAAAWVRDRDAEATLYERPWVDQFKALIPVGGMVLDLGCGSGTPIASHLTNAGYAVTGVDASPEMVAFFGERQPLATVHLADMRTLDLHRKFSGILAWDRFVLKMIHKPPLALTRESRMFYEFGKHDD
jgi:SAM-dependent methyltransferase